MFIYIPDNLKIFSSISSLPILHSTLADTPHTLPTHGGPIIISPSPHSSSSSASQQSFHCLATSNTFLVIVFYPSRFLQALSLSSSIYPFPPLLPPLSPKQQGQSPAVTESSRTKRTTTTTTTISDYCQDPLTTRLQRTRVHETGGRR